MPSECPDYPIIQDSFDSGYAFPVSLAFTIGDTGDEAIAVDALIGCEGSKEHYVMLLLAFYLPQYATSYPGYQAYIQERDFDPPNENTSILDSGIIGDFPIPLVQITGVPKATSECLLERLSDCTWRLFLTIQPACCCEGCDMADCADLVGTLQALNLTLACNNQHLDYITQVLVKTLPNREYLAAFAESISLISVQNSNQIAQSIICAAQAISEKRVPIPDYPAASALTLEDLGTVDIVLGGVYDCILIPPPPPPPPL